MVVVVMRVMVDRGRRVMVVVVMGVMVDRGRRVVMVVMIVVGRGEVMPMVAMMMIWQKVLSLMVDNVGLMCQMSCGTVVAVVGLLQNRG